MKETTRWYVSGMVASRNYWLAEIPKIQVASFVRGLSVGVSISLIVVELSLWLAQ